MMERHYEYVVLGAGPAGLQMGYYLQKAGRSYCIFERGSAPGTFFRRFPRHRTLISNNKVYTGFEDPEMNLRWDWNSLLSDNHTPLFKQYSVKYFPPADCLLAYLADYAAQHELRVECSRNVVKIRKDAVFFLEDSEGEITTCDRLISATGVSQAYRPSIAGVETADHYFDVTIDPMGFANKRVLIVGKGNSAFETADNLIPTAALIHIVSPHPVRMAWKTHYVGDLRAVNNDFLDTYQLKSQNGVLDAVVRSIEKTDGVYRVALEYAHAQGEQETLTYDRVILCTGFRFDRSIFAESCSPEMMIHDRFPRQTHEFECTNVPGLYFAGTVTQALDFKHSTSGFIHGFRYNTRALHRILESKYHGREWPHARIGCDTGSVVDAIVRRVNRTSGLWQQFGFLCDLIVFDEDNGRAEYYEEQPVGYVKSQAVAPGLRRMAITLEFGKVEGDPFQIERFPTPEMSSRSVFLHPVVRCYAGRELIAEHHMLEDLFGEWRKPDVHVAPLGEFLDNTNWASVQAAGA
jgi:thioredoxin reductase